jgi:hypothetical protein
MEVEHFGLTQNLMIAAGVDRVHHTVEALAAALGGGSA